jgi:hypothetical protein
MEQTTVGRFDEGEIGRGHKKCVENSEMFEMSHAKSE